MKFSISAVWDDTVRMLRTNASLLLAIAGVFLFLPAVLSSYLAPPPTGGNEGVTPAMMMGYYADNALALLLVQLVGFIGNLALLILCLDGGRPTVGGAIRGAVVLLPAYFLASLLSGAIVGLGLILFVLTGLYLLGRLAVTGPIVVAERVRNPLTVIKRSFAITKGRGWAIASLILIVLVTYLVVNLAVVTVFGSIFLLLDRAAGAGGVGALLLLILQSVAGAAFQTVLIVLLASLYRRLVAPEPQTSGI